MQALRRDYVPPGDAAAPGARPPRSRNGLVAFGRGAQRPAPRPARDRSLHRTSSVRQYGRSLLSVRRLVSHDCNGDDPAVRRRDGPDRARDERSVASALVRPGAVAGAKVIAMVMHAFRAREGSRRRVRDTRGRRRAGLEGRSTALPVHASRGHVGVATALHQTQASGRRDARDCIADGAAASGTIRGPVLVVLGDGGHGRSPTRMQYSSRDCSAALLRLLRRRSSRAESHAL